MEKLREPNVTYSMFTHVDTGGTSSLPTLNQNYTDGQCYSRRCFKYGVLAGIIMVLVVGLVIVYWLTKDANTLHPKNKEQASLPCEYLNTLIEEEKTHVNNTPAELFKCIYNTSKAIFTSDYQNTSREKETTHVNNTPAELFTCVYNTPKEYLEKLSKDPFGDKCRKNLEYVYCSCNNPGHSSQNCNSCGHSGPNLPNFCFCDAISQCGNRYDACGKTACKTCSEYFLTSPYKGRGKCSCSKTDFMIPSSCSCHEGFSNLMCSSIEKRICRSRFEIKQTLKSCVESNDETCVLKGCYGVELVCEFFNDGNDDLRKKSDTCKITNVNNTECILTERTTTEQGKENKLPPDTSLRNKSDTCEKIFAHVLINALMCAMLAPKLILF